MKPFEYLVLLVLLLANSAYAGEAAIRAEMEKKFPYSKIISVSKTPYFGLYEVAFDDRLVYTDEKMTYLFSGNIIDMHTLKNLTEAREKQLYAIEFRYFAIRLRNQECEGQRQEKAGGLHRSELPVLQETGKRDGQSDQCNGLHFRVSDTARL